MIAVDPEKLRGELAAASEIAEPAERAARLYFLGTLLCATEDPSFHPHGFQALLGAAAAGSTSAAFEAGERLFSGRGMSADLSRAVALLQQAAEVGHLEAMLTLARALLPDELRRDEGVVWLKRAAEAGSEKALHLLGLAYVRGLGVSTDPTEGRRLQQLAADKGLAEAQLELALMLRQGLGGAADSVLADEWERRSAEAGQPRACLNLGARAANASPPRLDEMRSWYERAADGGSAEAAARLAILLLTGGQLDPDEEEARRWFLRAAELGYDWSKKVDSL